MNYLPFLFLLFYPFFLAAQNMVPNGDFEEEVVCAEYNLNCGPFAWRLTASDPPGYYSGSSHNDSVYDNHWTAFVPFSFPNQGPYREYLQVPILCPMVKGQAYLLRFRIKAREVAVKEIDIFFRPQVTITPYNQIIVAAPQLKLRNERYWYDEKDNWVTVNARYLADGTERYMLIGNFQPQLLTEHKRIYNTKKDLFKALYYIDDVWLTPEKGSVCDNSEYLRVLHADRRRHSMVPETFFPVYPPHPDEFTGTDSVRVILDQPVVLQHIFFDVDHYDLLPASYEELNKLAGLLLRRPDLCIDIEGHTDVTGNENHNTELAVNRAKAVADYLITKGIANERITFKGFASTRPVATNDTPEGRQSNRRVEFRLRSLRK